MPEYDDDTQRWERFRTPGPNDRLIPNLQVIAPLGRCFVHLPPDAPERGCLTAVANRLYNLGRVCYVHSTYHNGRLELTGHVRLTPREVAAFNSVFGGNGVFNGAGRFGAPDTTGARQRVVRSNARLLLRIARSVPQSQVFLKFMRDNNQVFRVKDGRIVYDRPLIHLDSAYNETLRFLLDGNLLHPVEGAPYYHFCAWCNAVLHSGILCECRKMDRFATTAPFNFYGKPNAKIPRHVGIELEIGCIDYRRAAPKLVNRLKKRLSRMGVSGKYDGSLTSEGMEFVTVPIAGRTAELDIIDMTRELARFGDLRPNLAGTHVHVNMSDVTHTSQVHNLLTNWNVWEDYIFERCLPHHRRRNYYCRPLDLDTYLSHGAERRETCAECGAEDPSTDWNYVTEVYVTSCCSAEVMETDHGGDLDSFARLGSQARSIHGDSTTERYRALNLCAFSEHKTVEFRFLESTLDGRRIVAAATFLSHLVNDSLNGKTFDRHNMHIHASNALDYLRESCPT